MQGEGEISWQTDRQTETTATVHRQTGTDKDRLQPQYTDRPGQTKTDYSHSAQTDRDRQRETTGTVRRQTWTDKERIQPQHRQGQRENTATVHRQCQRIQPQRTDKTGTDKERKQPRYTDRHGQTDRLQPKYTYPV